jgi:DUF1009 family protein
MDKLFAPQSFFAQDFLFQKSLKPVKLGVIAGAGDLPVILIQEAKRMGRQAIVIGITRDAEERLNSLTPEFYQISVGQVKKIINTLVETDARELVIIGKVSKDILFKPMHLDAKAIRILSKLKDKSDSSIFEAIAGEIELAEIKLIDQRTYLKKLLPQKGVMTKHKPSKEQWRDIEYGMDLARKIAELGIGQTVAVRDQIALAIEAIEGTDEAIRRGGKLCSKGGVVVAKAARQNQDFRFDVPAIGPNTIDILVESGAAVLAIESEKAFLLDAEETIQKANKAKISLVVV